MRKPRLIPAAKFARMLGMPRTTAPLPARDTRELRSRRQSVVVRLLHCVAQHHVGGGPRVPQLGREGAAEPLCERPQQGRADTVVVMRLDSMARWRCASFRTSRLIVSSRLSAPTIIAIALISLAPCSRMSAPAKSGRVVGSIANRRS